ncbi:YbhB/YbcL family Raf kinase inhibitor-like protein [Luteipulveratus flavus]|uniref:YbhB/YbcL family Raf kinase inhibitor-like protein n=1 Tax=Luteipulveratus flavus TaxID=3031728 RepID=A0ABT6C4X5_9MICO|nr:YbhB/YbcL family Raf kinase inhibitor-like protein [Luteipulveratus sp. YIM 133296]MDF8264001.1 YbhB/YbcL family Raf kinase inhibitor-like protein [Luteipulveratus sp. YIM 133296]
MNLDRPEHPDPYSLLPSVPPLQVSSDSFSDGDTLPEAQVFDDWGMSGANTSPQLSWSGAPEGTTSYAITCFDPDAPTPSGFWHWLLIGIPAGTTSLPAGAGDGSDLPPGAFQIRNDFGAQAYGGAAPPAGDRPHRYMFAVHAIGGDALPIDDTASAAAAAFNIGGQQLARGVITATYAVS